MFNIDFYGIWKLPTGWIVNAAIVLDKIELDPIKFIEQAVVYAIVTKSVDSVSVKLRLLTNPEICIEIE